MTASKWLLLYLGLKIIIQATSVEADYLIAIRIHDFSTTCDDCATFFRYCVDERCLQSHQTMQPGTKQDFAQEFILLRQNPILFRGSTPAWDGVQVSVAAQYQNRSEETILLSEAQHNLSTDNVQLGVEITPPTSMGPMEYSNLTISVVVTCAEHWFGQHCSIWCQGPNCVCDQSAPCHDNCVGVVCGENRHCVDGVDQYVCTCDQGFTGRQCEINIDECEGVNCSGNGRCVDGAGYIQCECDSGYSGVLCEITDVDAEAEGSTILGNNTLEILIAGAIGWALLIFLALVVIVVLICTRSKSTSQSATTNINSEQTHQNVSYHTVAPDIGANVNYTLQVPGVATTRVNISHRENESTLVYNHAYEARGSGLYEELDCD